MPCGFDALPSPIFDYARECCESSDVGLSKSVDQLKQVLVRIVSKSEPPRKADIELLSKLTHALDDKSASTKRASNLVQSALCLCAELQMNNRMLDEAADSLARARAMGYEPSSKIGFLCDYIEFQISIHRGEYADARPTLRRKLNQAARALGPENHLTAWMAIDLARHDEEVGKANMDNIVRAYENDYSQSKPDSNARLMRAWAQLTIAEDNLQMNALDSACEWSDRAIVTLIKESPTSQSFGHCYFVAAMANARRGRLEEAMLLVDQIDSIAKLAAGDSTVLVARGYCVRSYVSWRRNKFQEGLGYATQAVELLQGQFGKEHPVLIDSLLLRFECYYYMKRIDEATSTGVLIARICLVGNCNRMLAPALHRLARCKWASGDLESALDVYELAKKLYEKTYYRNHPYTRDADCELQRVKNALRGRAAKSI